MCSLVSDIFHLKCMDEHCKQYPSNTAPAGFTCPTCSSAVFPASNLVSPVADVLREVLTSRAWAREGLGLPLLPFDTPVQNKTIPDFTPEVKLPEKHGPSYSVINVEAESPNTFHRNEPGEHFQSSAFIFS